MCLIVFSYQSHPEYELIVAANRDEFYERSTQEAHFWENESHILAGKDLQAGGTWMGISKSGKFSALTNYRDLTTLKENPPSRGALVTDYLRTSDYTEKYLQNILPDAKAYNGFNLLLKDRTGFYHFSNHTMRTTPIEPGVHGVSNAVLDTPWNKLERAKANLKKATSADYVDEEALFELLMDDTPAPDADLPETGLTYEMEKLVSSIFIKSERYGTRCSTLLLMDYKGNMKYVERRYDRDQNRISGTKSFELEVTNQE